MMIRAANEPRTMDGSTDCKHSLPPTAEELPVSQMYPLLLESAELNACKQVFTHQAQNIFQAANALLLSIERELRDEIKQNEPLKSAAIKDPHIQKTLKQIDSCIHNIQTLVKTYRTKLTGLAQLDILLDESLSVDAKKYHAKITELLSLKESLLHSIKIAASICYYHLLYPDYPDKDDTELKIDTIAAVKSFNDYYIKSKAAVDVMLGNRVIPIKERVIYNSIFAKIAEIDEENNLFFKNFDLRATDIKSTLNLINEIKNKANQYTNRWTFWDYYPDFFNIINTEIESSPYWVPDLLYQAEARVQTACEIITENYKKTTSYSIAKEENNLIKLNNNINYHLAKIKSLRSSLQDYRLQRETISIMLGTLVQLWKQRHCKTSCSEDLSSLPTSGSLLHMMRILVAHYDNHTPLQGLQKVKEFAQRCNKKFYSLFAEIDPAHRSAELNRDLALDLKLFAKKPSEWSAPESVVHDVVERMVTVIERH